MDVVRVLLGELLVVEPHHQHGNGYECEDGSKDDNESDDELVVWWAFSWGG